MIESQFSAEGLEKLKKELEHLKTNKRKEIAERLKQAIALGDLSENAAYHEAKESQGFLEGRILELEKIIRSARVIQKNAGSDRVVLGSKVQLLLNGEKAELEIVGAHEANPLADKISNQSPLGQAIFGKKKKDKGEIITQQGRLSFQILDVR
jgi:transcription elongation factor GreA